MPTYYIRQVSDGEIVNACETDGPVSNLADLLQGFENPETLWVDPNPPISVLKRYRYWDERP